MQSPPLHPAWAGDTLHPRNPTRGRGSGRWTQVRRSPHRTGSDLSALLAVLSRSEQGGGTWSVPGVTTLQSPHPIRTCHLKNRDPLSQGSLNVTGSCVCELHGTWQRTGPMECFRDPPCYHATQSKDPVWGARPPSVTPGGVQNGGGRTGIDQAAPASQVLSPKLPQESPPQ